MIGVLVAVSARTRAQRVVRDMLPAAVYDLKSSGADSSLRFRMTLSENEHGLHHQ